MFKEDLHSVGEIENKDTLDLLIPIEIFLNKLLSRIDELQSGEQAQLFDRERQ